MNHSFDIEHAEKYGLLPAICLCQFQFWITQNKANGRNEHEGRTWTYNSNKAFQKMFPYLTGKQIRRALEELVKADIIITGNFNANSYDRTLWYAFKDESIFLLRHLDAPCRANGSAESGKTITIKETKEEPVKGKTAFLFSFSSENLPPPLNTPEMQDAWDEWQEHCRQRRNKLSEGSARAQIKKMQEWGPERAIAAIKHSIFKNWKSIFEEKDTDRNGHRNAKAAEDYKNLTAENAL